MFTNKENKSVVFSQVEQQCQRRLFSNLQIGRNIAYIFLLDFPIFYRFSAILGGINL